MSVSSGNRDDQLPPASSLGNIGEVSKLSSSGEPSYMDGVVKLVREFELGAEGVIAKRSLGETVCDEVAVGAVWPSATSKAPGG